MEDIKKMSLEDFRSVVEEYNYMSTPVDKRYRSKISNSQKQMINKNKEMFNKVK